MSFHTCMWLFTFYNMSKHYRMLFWHRYMQYGHIVLFYIVSISYNTIERIFIWKEKKTTRKYLSNITGKTTSAKCMLHHFFAEMGEMLKVRVKQNGGWILIGQVWSPSIPCSWPSLSELFLSPVEPAANIDPAPPWRPAPDWLHSSLSPP